MRREDTQKVRAWLISKYPNIGSNEFDALLAELESRGMAAEPTIIDRILRHRFPEAFSKEKNMSTNRVVPPLSSRAAPQQSIEDVVQVVKKYEQSGHWQACASQFESPARSKANFAILAQAIKDFRETGKHIRVADIAEIVMRLASAGVFERVPTVVEVPVEAPPKPEPDARELHNRQVRIDRAMNDSETHPVRGAKEKAQPLIKPIDNTNIAEQIASEKAAEDNAIVREAHRLISVFTGSSHSRTFSGRAHLESVLTAALDAGKSAPEVLEAVQQAADKLQDSGSIR